MDLIWLLGNFAPVGNFELNVVSISAYFLGSAPSWCRSMVCRSRWWLRVERGVQEEHHDLQEGVRQSLPSDARCKFALDEAQMCSVPGPCAIAIVLAF